MDGFPISVRLVRTSMSAIILAGGALLLAPKSARACTPEPTGCCSCVAYRHPDGGAHVTCCCWEGDGSFNGCATQHAM